MGDGCFKYVNEVKLIGLSKLERMVIGKKSFGKEKLAENMQALMSAIVKAKPAAAKGKYLRNVTLTSTMGPGIKLNPAKFSE